MLGRSVLASLSRSAVGIPALWSKTACLQNRSSSDTATHNPVDDAEAALRDRQRKLREKAFTEPPVDGAAFVSTPQQTSNVFYQPTVLTARQRQVYESVSVSKAGLADHGFLYGLTEADLSGRSDLVRRALSTRTGSTEDLLRFRRSEIVKKYGTTPVDTGASRVQVRREAEPRVTLPHSFCCCCRWPSSQSASTVCPRTSGRTGTTSTPSALWGSSRSSVATCSST